MPPHCSEGGGVGGEDSPMNVRGRSSVQIRIRLLEINLGMTWANPYEA